MLILRQIPKVPLFSMAQPSVVVGMAPKDVEK